MTVSETEFRNAVLDARLPVPSGLQDSAGGPAGSRFSVYRNNVVLSLTEALATAFPLLRKLLGTESFDQLAAIFVRSHPPSSPLMMFYGAEMPAFLKHFAPLQHIGYLPDCARLDLALRHAYHAADAAPLPAAALQDGAVALQLRLSLAPAARVLRSQWPLYDIWRFNTDANAPKPRAVAQDVLVVRPEFDPEPHLLPPGAADWLQHLHNGLTLGEAAERTLETTADFDLAAALSLAVSNGALVDLTTKDT